MIPAASDQQVRLESQASSDEHLIKLWLHGKSAHTKEAYSRDINQFREFVGKAFSNVKLDDVHAWINSLIRMDLSASTIARKTASMKSLFTFANKIGYTRFNVGAAVTTPKVPDDLAERILDQQSVRRILAAADNLRDDVLIQLFYASGGRVSELSGLRWRSVLARDSDRGQVMLHGKGSKSRNVLLTPSTWRSLQVLREAELNKGFGHATDPVFRSKKGGHLTRQQLWRIVKKAASVAGLPNAVSPHWLRHAHASHALDNGAPVHLVKDTLGHKSLATTSRYAHAKPNDSSANYLDPD